MPGRPRQRLRVTLAPSSRQIINLNAPTCFYRDYVLTQFHPDVVSMHMQTYCLVS